VGPRLLRPRDARQPVASGNSSRIYEITKGPAEAQRKNKTPGPRTGRFCAALERLALQGAAGLHLPPSVGWLHTLLFMAWVTTWTQSSATPGGSEGLVHCAPIAAAAGPAFR